MESGIHSAHRSRKVQEMTGGKTTMMMTARNKRRPNSNVQRRKRVQEESRIVKPGRKDVHPSEGNRPATNHPEVTRKSKRFQWTLVRPKVKVTTMTVMKVAYFLLRTLVTATSTLTCNAKALTVACSHLQRMCCAVGDWKWHARTLRVASHANHPEFPTHPVRRIHWEVPVTNGVDLARKQTRILLARQATASHRPGERGRPLGVPRNG